MGKLMKYEIKGSYRFILGVLATTLILSLANYMYLGKISNTGDMTASGGLFIAISFTVIFGIILATFFYLVNLFRKELYEDRGYLTFTLPVSGKQILASKVIVTFLWFVLIGATFIIANIIGAVMIMPKDVFNLLLRELRSFDLNLLNIQWKTLISSIITGIGNGSHILLLIYFSMTLGRVSFKNKRFKGIWFIFYIIFSIIISLIGSKIMELLPYYLNISNFSIEKLNNNFYFGSGQFNFSGDLLVNIPYIFYRLAIILGLFFGTSKLLEDKIDL